MILCDFSGSVWDHLIGKAHLKEYKEHMASEIRSTLQQEISEAGLAYGLPMSWISFTWVWVNFYCTKKASKHGFMMVDDGWWWLMMVVDGLFQPKLLFLIIIY